MIKENIWKVSSHYADGGGKCITIEDKDGNEIIGEFGVSGRVAEQIKDEHNNYNELINALQAILDEMPSKVSLPLTVAIKEIAQVAINKYK